MIEMQMTETLIDIHKAYLAVIIKSENKVYRPLGARDSQGERDLHSARATALQIVLRPKKVYILTILGENKVSFMKISREVDLLTIAQHSTW